MTPSLAEAAVGLIGVRFRLHGRDPETGLDCVGLVAEAMRRAGIEPIVPSGYRLRNCSVTGFLPFARANHFTSVEVHDQPDVLLAMVNPVQPHLVIAVPGGAVHAHAGLGQVTFMPGELPWPVVASWRLPPPTHQIRN